MASDFRPYEFEADQLHRALFGKRCPSLVRDLYVSANSDLEGWWSFDSKDITWLTRVIKVNICLAELAWLAKSHKSHPKDILWVKMHSMLYLTELAGMNWALRNKKSPRAWISLAGEVLAKPIRIAVAGVRLIIDV